MTRNRSRAGIILRVRSFCQFIFQFGIAKHAESHAGRIAPWGCHFCGPDDSIVMTPLEFARCLSDECVLPLGLRFRFDGFGQEHGFRVCSQHKCKDRSVDHI